MPTFIDEFGTFRWDDHSATHFTHFTLTAVWFETPELAVQCEGVINGLRQALGLPAGAEFHFANASDNVRTAFVQAVSACKFHYVTCTVQKWRNNKWLEPRMWRKRAYFYERVIQPVVISLTEYLLVAEVCKGKALCETVTYDEHTDPFYRTALRDEFYRPKAPNGRSFVVKVRPGKSDSDSLVQLADMVCGSYAHSFDSSDKYVKLLKPREIEHIFVP